MKVWRKQFHLTFVIKESLGPCWSSQTCKD